MANLDLSKYGITGVTEILHNPSYDVLFAEETKPGLEGFEKGQVTELGAVNVMTGIYTGRSPKDKFFVKNEASADSVWWTSDEYKNDNKPCTEEAWTDLKAKAVKQLSGKRLFVVDTFCGANEATRMKVRFIMEVAWQAHFVTNMFIRPTAEELEASDKVTVINSANLSTGIGLQVIQAAILASEGKTAAEITTAIEAIRPKVRASFVVDTLTYLHRGGRCSAVAALAGGMLKLHPRIVVVDGAMDASKKYRGKLSSVILSYTRDMEEDLKNAVPDRVFITHSGCDREIVEAVRSYLESLGIFDEILETRAGGVVSSHCGPGTLGVLFIAK